MKTKTIRRAPLLALLAPSAVALLAHGNAEAAPTSTTTLVAANGMCLDVSSGQAALVTCDGSAAQRFTITPGGSGPIVNGGRCLDDLYGAGNTLEMTACTGTPEQTWAFEGVPAAAVAVNGASHCLDIFTYDQVSGMPVYPMGCGGAETFRYTPLPCAPGFATGGDGACECAYPLVSVSVTSNTFNTLVAPALTGINVSVTNDVVSVTLPSGLGGSVPSSTLSINGATVDSLQIEGWNWSMSSSSAAISVAATLEAQISIPKVGVDCGITVYVDNAPLTMTLTSGAGGALQVGSVSVPLTSSNTNWTGCAFSPGIGNPRPQIESQIESALKSQLSGQAFMAQALNKILQDVVTGDPLAVELPEKYPGFSWICDQASLTTGAIAGTCSGQCPPVTPPIPVCDPAGMSEGCSGDVTATCGPLSYTMQLFRQNPATGQWIPLGTGQDPSGAPIVGTYEYKVCAENESLSTCTPPFSFTSTAASGCGGSSGGGWNPGGKPCGGHVCPQ